MRFHLELSEEAAISMQDRYPCPIGGLSGWWFDLVAACTHLEGAWRGEGSFTAYTRRLVIDGEHPDRDPVATRLVRELVEATNGVTS
jgi:hypothetical protein